MFRGTCNIAPSAPGQTRDVASLGRSQAVRQRVLIPPRGGSNPPAPASDIQQQRLSAGLVAERNTAFSDPLHVKYFEEIKRSIQRSFWHVIIWSVFPSITGKHMLRVLTLSGAFAGALVFASTPAYAQSPLGNWARGDGNALVRIAACGASLCATNTWIREPGSERVGHVLIMKVKKIAASLWKGSAYDPQRKLTVSIEMRVGEQTMSTSGCVAGGLLCKTTKWTRSR